MGYWFHFHLGDSVPPGTFHLLLGTFYTPLLRDFMRDERLLVVYTPLLLLVVVNPAEIRLVKGVYF